MTGQPSKGSLERARAFFIGFFGNGADKQYRHGIDVLALEFDAIAEERDAALIRANSGSELITLRQQNAALVSALWELESRWRVLAYHHPFAGAGIIACADDLQRLLAIYTPAKEKEQP